MFFLWQDLMGLIFAGPWQLSATQGWPLKEEIGPIQQMKVPVAWIHSWLSFGL
jgi:hypothetical protein